MQSSVYVIIFLVNKKQKIYKDWKNLFLIDLLRKAILFFSVIYKFVRDLIGHFLAHVGSRFIYSNAHVFLIVMKIKSFANRERE